MDLSSGEDDYSGDYDSINLNALNGIESDQDSFLRLQNPTVATPTKHSHVVTPTPFFKSTTINPANNFVVAGSTPSNFQSTVVGSSLNFGSQIKTNPFISGSSSAGVGNSDGDRLPPGSAGFGTVEAVDLGSVFVQPSGPVLQNQNLIKSTLQNQNQVQFPTKSNDGGLPDYNQAHAVQQQNLNNNFVNNNQPSAQLNIANGFQQVNAPQQNLNFANTFSQVNPPQNLNNNVGFGTATPIRGTHQSFKETFPVDVGLPVNNQFNPSSPLNQQPQQINPNAPWVGANNQQQLLFQQQQQQFNNQPFLPVLQGQSNLGVFQTTERPFGLNERPVRFPADAASRLDYDQDYSFDSQVYYDMPYDIYTTKGTTKSWNVNNDNSEKQNYITPAPTSNIIAELAKYSDKKNLIHRPISSDPYIQYPGVNEYSEPDKELIMYPSGQLIANNNGYPTTMGPYLRQHLASNFQNLQHGQKPHYVMARKKPDYEKKTELFDPLLEGDEIIERSESVQSPAAAISDISKSDDEGKDGLWPMLIRTAKDDLKLVGDVIKLALSR